MKIYLFDHDDSEGTGLMALDETGLLALEKVYAPNNKITEEWVHRIKFDVALTSEHETAEVVYVKNPDDHDLVPKLWDLWQTGQRREAAPDEPVTDPGEVELLRASAHLCHRCLLQPICSVAQAIGASENVTLAVLSHCNSHIPKEQI